MPTERNAAPPRAALRIHPGEARAARVLVDQAYDDLLPRVRRGETQLTFVVLQWGWQASTLLDIESGCGRGHEVDLPDDELDDDERHDSVPLALWQWKCLWLLLGYGLHLYAEVDLSLERVWESLHEAMQEDRFAPEADREECRERYEGYRELRIGLERGRSLWRRIEVVVGRVAGEVSDDPLDAAAWILDPIPGEA